MPKVKNKPINFVDWLNRTEWETEEWLAANSHMSDYEIKKEWYEGFRSALIQVKGRLGSMS